MTRPAPRAAALVALFAVAGGLAALQHEAGAHRPPPPPAPRPLSAAPGGGPSTTTSGSGATAGPGAPAAPLDTQQASIASLLAAADDITRQVVALRGLETRRPIARGVLSRDEIGRKLQERIAKEYTSDEIRIESRLLKRLGMLPPDVDYQGLLLSLLQEQVAGFYDPFARQLYIADWLGIDLQRPAMAHELQHALQDQHFDLKSFATPIKDDGDRQLGRAALVEGDGTAVMMEFVAQSHGFDVANLPDRVIEQLGKQIASGAMDQSPIYSRAPRFLRETLLFPYFAGMQFIYALKREGGGWKRVDEAFKAPPESTEQVLHPEKFLGKEHPVAVTAAALSSLAPRKELRKDVLGELELRVLFAGSMDDGEAERAAAGWGGDRLVVYGEPGDEGKPVVVLDLSTWDSEEEAQQAESAFKVVMARGAKGSGSPSAPSVIERDGEAFAVERRGREVLALFGVPAAQRAAVSEEAWKGFTVGEHGEKARPVASGAGAASEKAKSKGKKK